MSKYLVTFQDEKECYESLLGVHVYRQKMWNNICEFKGDLPTEKEIDEISAYRTRGNYMDFTRHYTIVNMQKLAE